MAGRSRWLVGSSSSSRSDRHSRARGEAHPPAAGKGCHRVVDHLRGESQAVQQAAGARFGGIAVDRLHALVHIRQGLVVITALVADQRRLQRPQLGIAVDDEIQRRAVAGRRLLVHAGDHGIGRQGNGPGVGFQLAANQREQRRLAAAVATDQPQPVTGMDTQPGILDELIGAPAQGDMFQAQHCGSLNRMMRVESEAGPASTLVL